MTANPKDTWAQELDGCDLLRMEVSRGGCVPDGIPIGQQPTKPCEHYFEHLRSDTVLADVPESDKKIRIGDVDLFYCRRCLEYREVKR